MFNDYEYIQEIESGNKMSQNFRGVQSELDH